MTTVLEILMETGEGTYPPLAKIVREEEIV